jgi:hypothetical protein
MSNLSCFFANILEISVKLGYMFNSSDGFCQLTVHCEWGLRRGWNWLPLPDYIGTSQQDLSCEMRETHQMSHTYSMSPLIMYTLFDHFVTIINHEH